MDITEIVTRLDHSSEKRIVVLGDWCLDKYMYSDPKEDDISVETGMPAWQVYEKKMAAGVAGTITNNLRALGVQVTCVGYAGNDGEGFEMIKCLREIGTDTQYMITTDELCTATYLKTMRKTENGTYREDIRFDYRNRNSGSKALADKLIVNFEKAVEGADGVIVSDQFYERNTGTVGDYVKEKINELAAKYDIPFLVDSRAFASEFRNAYVKCNNFELMKYCGINGDPESTDEVYEGGKKLKQMTGRPVFITRNKDGIAVFEDGITQVPAYPVSGEIDVTGAGDASNAGIALGLSLGLSCTQAAMIACAVSSVTIQKLGETGTASIPEVKERLATIASMMS